ncbi:MAG: choice-of-anchor L domain-containing protein [bacterium]|nr:choice-of-anchor L domain-containing protein [bacterium]
MSRQRCGRAILLSNNDLTGHVRALTQSAACAALAALAVLAMLAAAVAPPAAAQVDMDGDGWADTDGDLYDVPGGGVTSPWLVNPGAYDVPGNGIDDDCDGTVDNPDGPCAAGDSLVNVNGLVLAQAMDICRVTPLAPPTRAQRRWGLISASLRRRPATGAPDPAQFAASAAFGSGFLPRAGGNLAVLSTGTARDADQPAHVPPAPGFSDATNQSLPPTDFTAPRGNRLASSPFCTAVSALNPVNDVVLLSLQLRVPSNADALIFDHAFFASQFPEVCDQFNDHFLALLYSSAPGLPADRNIALDALGNPVTVQTAFFRSCTPVAGQPCPDGTAALAGTGFDPANDATTGWNTSTAPVIPGETITLMFTIFDVGDHLFDSTVLIDNLSWHVMPQSPASAVDDDSLPGASRPLRAAPNPFNPSTKLTFSLPQGGPVNLVIYDLAGRRVATLLDAVMGAGEHSLVWNGRGDDGQGQPSGAYVARVTGGGVRTEVRLMLVK